MATRRKKRENGNMKVGESDTRTKYVPFHRLIRKHLKAPSLDRPFLSPSSPRLLFIVLQKFSLAGAGADRSHNQLLDEQKTRPTPTSCRLMTTRYQRPTDRTLFATLIRLGVNFFAPPITPTSMRHSSRLAGNGPGIHPPTTTTDCEKASV